MAFGARHATSGGARSTWSSGGPAAAARRCLLAPSPAICPPDPASGLPRRFGVCDVFGMQCWPCAHAPSPSPSQHSLARHPSAGLTSLLQGQLQAALAASLQVSALARKQASKCGRGEGEGEAGAACCVAMHDAALNDCLLSQHKHCCSAPRALHHPAGSPGCAIPEHGVEAGSDGGGCGVCVCVCVPRGWGRCTPPPPPLTCHWAPTAHTRGHAVHVQWWYVAQRLVNAPCPSGTATSPSPACFATLGLNPMGAPAQPSNPSDAGPMRFHPHPALPCTGAARKPQPFQPHQPDWRRRRRQLHSLLVLCRGHQRQRRQQRNPGAPPIAAAGSASLL